MVLLAAGPWTSYAFLLRQCPDFSLGYAILLVLACLSVLAMDAMILTELDHIVIYEFTRSIELYATNG